MSTNEKSGNLLFNIISFKLDSFDPGIFNFFNLPKKKKILEGWEMRQELQWR